MAWPQTVRKEDLVITYYRGSGPGGQHRNKTDSAVRILHKPTGHTAQSEEHKSQTNNKKAAFKRLTEILIPLMRQAAETGPDPSESASSERVRTYHNPRQKVKDHRSGREYSYADVLDGKGLDKIITDVITAKAAEGKK